MDVKKNILNFMSGGKKDKFTSNAEEFRSEEKSDDSSYFDINSTENEDLFCDANDIPVKEGDAMRKSKIERMIHRDQRKPYMFYPEDSSKANWDLFITIVLIYTCITTPMRIAFSNGDSLG